MTKRTWLIPAAAGSAILLYPSMPAVAEDLGPVYASGTQCEGQYDDNDNGSPLQFGIRDNDRNDDDYCYIDYGFAANDLSRRITREQDAFGYEWTSISPPSGKKTVYWKLCKERQNDPDICSGPPYSNGIYD